LDSLVANARVPNVRKMPPPAAAGGRRGLCLGVSVHHTACDDPDGLLGKTLSGRYEDARAGNGDASTGR
jgi:hypothetical protein